MTSDLGRRIKAARERKGWTQAHLATLMDVTHKTVGNWERGETVPQNRLGRLEEVLGPGIDPDAPQPVRVSHGVSPSEEITVLVAHLDQLSQMDLLRLSRLVIDLAMGREGDA